MWRMADWWTGGLDLGWAGLEGVGGERIRAVLANSGFLAKVSTQGRRGIILNRPSVAANTCGILCRCD